MDKYHVTKKDDGWQLKKEGAERASKTADTKEQIVRDAQKFMENKVGSVKIHLENGKIQEERTYQRKDDPKKSKG